MSAKLLLPLLIVACASGCLSISQMDFQHLLDQQNAVMRQMMLTLTTTTSGRSARVGVSNIDTCFDWYKQDQIDVTNTYDQNYTSCVNASTAARNLLSQQSTNEREILIGRGESICRELSNCEAVDDTLDFFVCYNNASDNNTQELYDIYAESERGVNTMKIQYQRITDDETVCTAAARNVYVNSLSSSASYLNQCLAGKWSPPEATAAPTTAAPTTAAPTTAEPTTEAPATEAPATEAPATEAPATEAPATEAPATEAPTTEAPATEAPTTEASSQTTEASELPESTDGDTPEADDTSQQGTLLEEDIYRYRPMTQ